MTQYVNYKNGVIRISSSRTLGSGKVVGNLKNDVIREGVSPSLGSGRAVANTKDGVIREGSSPSVGAGHVVGNVKNGYVLLKRCYKTYFSYPILLQVSGKSVSLQCVFHSIRFKVNKGWAQRSPFFMSIRFVCQLPFSFFAPFY